MIRTTEILTSKSHIEPLRDEGYIIYKLGFLGTKRDGKRSMYPLWGNVKQQQSTAESNSNTYIFYPSENQTEFTISLKAVSTSIRVFLNLVRLHPSKYTISGNTITILVPIKSGDVVRIFFDLWKESEWIYNEIPTGAIDGENKEFTLANDPNPDTIELSNNGGLMYKNQYTVSGKTITTTLAIPENDSLMVDYQKFISDPKIYNEEPSGVIDGENTTFTLSRIPATGTVRTLVNGKRQVPPLDIEYSDDQIILSKAPDPGDTIICDYDYNI